MDNIPIFTKLCKLRSTEKHTHTEDFFTELWAFTLRRNSDLCAHILNKIHVALPNVPYNIDTQIQCSASSLPSSSKDCRPDIRFQSSDHNLFVEHKIDAKQHHEVVEANEGTKHYSQVERYLHIDNRSYVAYITLTPESIDDTVLQNPRYCRPENRDHFVWSDFYPIVESYSFKKDADPFLVELVRFMESLSMHPPKKGVGMIPSTNEPNMKAERKARALWWHPAIELLERNGWRCFRKGLEAEFCIGSDDYPSLFYDMRFGEVDSVKDGVLKVRMRLMGDVAIPMGSILYDFKKLGFETKRSPYVSKKKQRFTDVICLTKQTRTEFIGSEEPGKRLADFAEMTLRVIHKYLDLPEVIQ